MPETKNVDVVIVGGGLGGLLCAARLSESGHQVQLVERSSSLGGRAKGSPKADHIFDRGPHALYCKGAAIAALRSHGIEPKGGVVSPGGVLLEGGRPIGALPGSAASLLFGRALTGRDRWALAKLMMQLPKIDPEPLASTTLDSWIRAHKLPDRAAAFMRSLARLATYVNAPDLSAGAAISQIQLALGGVLYLDGSWQQLIDQLEALCRERGVGLSLGASVASITGLGNRREQIVLSDGSSICAKAVVVAAGPKVASKLYQKPFPAQPARASCLSVALSTPPAARFAIGLDTPHYYSAASLTAKLSPDGGGLVHVMRYLAPDKRSSAANTRADLEPVLDQLQPGWRAVRVAEQVLPNIIATHWAPTAATHGFLGRPRAIVSPSRYIVGDWVGQKGHLLDAAANSAESVAALLNTQLQRAMEIAI